MKDEIAAAVLFLTRFIRKNETVEEGQIVEFSTRLSTILLERFKNHWFPDKPAKGQGYRCIRVNETERIDPVLEKAAVDSGLKYDDLKLPVEVTIWVDPKEVCCRFGEDEGSYCTLASFKGAKKENYVNVINVDELERRQRERSKQMALEFMKGRPKHNHSNSNNNNNNSNIIAKKKNNLQNTNYQQLLQQHIQQQHLTKVSQRLHIYRPNNTSNSNRNDRFHWVNRALVKS